MFKCFQALRGILSVRVASFSRRGALLAHAKTGRVEQSSAIIFLSDGASQPRNFVPNVVGIPFISVFFFIFFRWTPPYEAMTLFIELHFLFFLWVNFWVKYIGLLKWGASDNRCDASPLSDYYRPWSLLFIGLHCCCRFFPKAV